MRKLFRFKYEPCNKTCYCYCSKLMTELRALPKERREYLVDTMVKAHDRLCDNPNYSFGVDVDENLNIFVGHLRTPISTDLYANTSFETAVLDVCNHVMKQDIPVMSGDCCFGDNGAESLGREILKFCTDVGYAEILESHCTCKAA